MTRRLQWFAQAVKRGCEKAVARSLRSLRAGRVFANLFRAAPARQAVDISLRRPAGSDHARAVSRVGGFPGAETRGLSSPGGSGSLQRSVAVEINHEMVCAVEGGRTARAESRLFLTA